MLHFFPRKSLCLFCITQKCRTEKETHIKMVQLVSLSFSFRRYLSRIHAEDSTTTVFCHVNYACWSTQQIKRKNLDFRCAHTATLFSIFFFHTNHIECKCTVRARGVCLFEKLKLHISASRRFSFASIMGDATVCWTTLVNFSSVPHRAHCEHFFTHRGFMNCIVTLDSHKFVCSVWRMSVFCWSTLQMEMKLWSNMKIKNKVLLECHEK